MVGEVEKHTQTGLLLVLAVANVAGVAMAPETENEVLAQVAVNSAQIDQLTEEVSELSTVVRNTNDNEFDDIAQAFAEMNTALALIRDEVNDLKAENNRQ